jgi:PAS domain S-box-containing protein
VIDNDKRLALIHPQDRARAIESFTAAANSDGSSVYQIEKRIVWPDGSIRWVASLGRVFFDESLPGVPGARKPQRLAGVALDITERKAAAERIRRNEERLRRMMETAQIGIAFARATGEILECNDALLQMFGCTRAEYEAGNFNWRELGQPRDDEYNEHLLRQLGEAGAVRPFERIFRRRDGTSIPTMVSAALLAASGGSPQDAHSGEHIAFVVDLTELKQAERALQELNATLEQRVAERTRDLELSNAELQRSNRELDHFAYVASHDLRAPLRAVSNLAAWISEDAGSLVPPRTQEHIAKLRNRVRRLEAMVEDLLLYSRAGRKLHPSEWVDTEALVRTIVELLSPPPGFAVQVVGELPLVHCERIPLETVLRNLIQNAIKHHHHPSAACVLISAHAARSANDSAAAGDDGVMVEFCVQDDGPGIAPEYHARIFDVFQTLRPRDQVEGSGMGLAIVKKLVEHVGGRIWVQSSPGEGAAFFFTWPKVLPSP